jgi:hypothetical protein
MSIGFIPLPYGCRDIKIYPITADVAASVGVDLPNARTLQFAETEQFTDLRGDDALKAEHGAGPQVDWSLEAGGVSFEAVKALFGGTITETGVTPSGVKTFSVLGTKIRPYFMLMGQAISDSGGDFVVKIYKCKCTGDFTGTMQDSNFWLSGTKGTGLPDVNNKLYDFVQNETASTLA